MTAILRNAIFISLVGHFALFGLFSFSFSKIPEASCRGIYFWGDFLASVKNRRQIPFSGNITPIRLSRYNINIKVRDSLMGLPHPYSKPALPLALEQDKLSYRPAITGAYQAQDRKAGPLVFYPELPYYFSLYFQDRQVAHIELAFNIMTADGRSEVDIKRKISSGNLEADLLSMRYINHYLFIQKERFVPGVWQKVKIELEAKNDDYR